MAELQAGPRQRKRRGRGAYGPVFEQQAISTCFWAGRVKAFDLSGEKKEARSSGTTPAPIQVRQEGV